MWYINDEPAARVLVMGGGAVRSFHPESGNTMLITALERQRSEQEVSDNRPDATQPTPATLPYTSSRYDGWGVRPLDEHDPDL